jgi:hypothetical protein
MRVECVMLTEKDLPDMFARFRDISDMHHVFRASRLNTQWIHTVLGLQLLANDFF